MFSRITIACLLLAGFLTGTELQANETSLDQLLDKVLAANLQLKASEFSRNAARARIEQAGQKPVIRMGIDVDNVAGTGKVSGFDGSETTLRLSRVLERGRKPELRRQLASRELGKINTELAIEQRDVLARATAGFLRVLAYQALYDIAMDSKNYEARQLNAVRAGVKSGKYFSGQDALQEALLTKSELELEHREHLLDSERSKLASLYGGKPASLGKLSGDLYQLEEPGSFDRILATLEQSLEIQLAEQEANVFSAKQSLDATRAFPDLELSAGVRHLASLDDSALVFSVSMPLGTKGNARAYTQESQQLAEQHDLESQQMKRELKARLFELYQEMRHAHTAVNTLKKQMLPAVSKAFESYQNGFRNGRISLLEVSSAHEKLIETRRHLVEEALDFHLYQLELDRLSGRLAMKGATQ